MGDRTVRIALVGIGNLGSRLVRILNDKAAQLSCRWGVRFSVVAVADSRGYAVNGDGIESAEILAARQEGRSVGELPGAGRPRGAALEMLETADYDVLCEASPVNWSRDCEPGLSHVRAALRRGHHVVTPNKGPIAKAGRELDALARENGAALRFDGTVAGGLPALSVGMRDLRGATVRRIDAVPNLSTGLVLDLLADGRTWDEALDEARQQGALEADPAWDLEGWDAAAKLVILARTVQDADVDLADVARCGIRDLAADDLVAAHRDGERMRLVASSAPDGDGFALHVRPERIGDSHPLAGLPDHGMGVVFHTDLFGVITLTIQETDPTPSAATMLRDLLDIYVEGDRPTGGS